MWQTTDEVMLRHYSAACVLLDAAVNTLLRQEIFHSHPFPDYPDLPSKKIILQRLSSARSIAYFPSFVRWKLHIGTRGIRVLLAGGMLFFGC